MWLASGIDVATVQAGGCSSDSTPSLGTSICHGYSPKRQKDQKKKKNEELQLWRNGIGSVLGVLACEFNPWPSRGC